MPSRKKGREEESRRGAQAPLAPARCSVLLSAPSGWHSHLFRRLRTAKAQCVSQRRKMASLRHHATSHPKNGSEDEMRRGEMRYTREADVCRECYHCSSLALCVGVALGRRTSGTQKLALLRWRDGTRRPAYGPKSAQCLTQGCLGVDAAQGHPLHVLSCLELRCHLRPRLRFPTRPPLPGVVSHDHDFARRDVPPQN